MKYIKVNKVNPFDTFNKFRLKAEGVHFRERAQALAQVSQL